MKKIFYFSVTLSCLLMLVGCTATPKESRSTTNDNELTVSQLKEIYGDASAYNVNTTRIELKDIVVDSGNTTFNFTFVSNRDLSEFFKNGFYQTEYDARLTIALDKNQVLYTSDLFKVEVKEGNDLFVFKLDDDSISGIFDTSNVVYISLQIYNAATELFAEYNFVGAGNSFIKE